MKRSLLLCSFALICTPSFASFEMILATMEGSSAIHRLDPENQIRLGSFGSSRLIAPRGLAVDQAANEVYILNQYGSGVGRITVMDYNTGSFKREWSLGSSIGGAKDIEFSSVGLLVPTSTGVNRYSSTGSLVQSYNSFGGVAAEIVTYDGSFNEIYTFNGTNAPGTANILSGAATFPISHGLIGLNSITRSPFNGRHIAANGVSILSFNPGPLSFNSATLSPFTVNGIAFGHGDTIYVGGGAAVQGQITGFNHSFQSLGSNWDIPSSTRITSMTSVLAPEPGSMLAIAAGLGFLARKRSTSKK